MRTYGTLTFVDKEWNITGAPHVLMMLKRVFERIDKSQFGVVKFKRTSETDKNLQWFIMRYPLKMDDTTKSLLDRGAKSHDDRILSLEELTHSNWQPKEFKLALALRRYQAIAAEMWLRQGFLLIGDDLGLGKTAEVIGGMIHTVMRPGCVVVPTHLQTQWRKEFAKFAPEMKIYTIPDTSGGHLPAADAYIITYSKIHAWVQHLQHVCKSLAFDECAELRRDESNKHKAAKAIADQMDYVAGMSATPVYNLGGEIFNVLNVLKDGVVGTREEFLREWCTSQGNGKYLLKDPDAFGSHIRDNYIMLRRTRQFVGKQLPPVNKIVHHVDADMQEFAKINNKATELAKVIMSRTEIYKGQKLNASAELKNLIRQATGVAKAPYLADFIQMLVDSGEKVVVGLWHRLVYDVIRARLAKETRVEMYTGTESTAQKDRAAELFIRGEVDVFLISLRSGAGLDGLQQKASVVVIGELDWSPAVIDQLVGRLNRDGQDRPVTVYYVLSTAGSDPVISDLLGLKKSQINGIINPNASIFEKVSADDSGIRAIAEKIMSGRGLLDQTPAPKTRKMLDAPIDSSVVYVTLPPLPARNGLPSARPVAIAR